MNCLKGIRGKSISGSKKIGLSLILAASTFAICTAGLLSTHPAGAQGLGSASRVIGGRVFAAGGAPTGGAIVYLKDQKSLEIKTYISTKDGTYRFGQLSSADDYLLWAELGGHKSKNKTISSFDSKKVFDISLHIEDK